MNVVETSPVNIALRTLSDDERRKVWAWFDHLRNWESDAFVREHSKELPGSQGVYVFQTTDDLRIFFRLESDRIVLLDIATKDTLLRTANGSRVDA